MTSHTNPGGWTIAELLALLPQEHPMWFRDAVPSLREDRGHFIAQVVQSMETQAHALPRVHVAMVLVGLGEPAGIRAFLQALRGGDPKARLYAVGALGDIWTCCRLGFDSNALDVPLTAAEVVGAIAPLLAQPDSDVGETALWFCLWRAFAESRELTRPLLDYPCAEVRISVVEAYFHEHVDDGALQATMAALLAPKPVQADRYAKALEKLCREGAEPIKSHAGRTAAHVLAKTLALPHDAGCLDYLVDAAHHGLGEGAREVLGSVIRHHSLPACTRANAMLHLAQHAGLAEGALAVMDELVVDVDASAEQRAALLERFAQRLGVAALEPLLRGLGDAGMRELLLDPVVKLPHGTYDPDVIAALKSALAQEPGWKAHRIARALVDRGDESAEVIGRLAPMEAMEWHWKNDAVTPRVAARALVAAGAMDPIEEAELAAYVPPHYDTAENVLMGLVHHRSREAVFRLRDDEFDPKHDEVFAALVKNVRPALHLESLAQERDEVCTDMGERDGVPIISMEGTTCKIRFVHEGREHSFLAAPGGSWMDTQAVMRAFDRFMRELGREERVYRVDWGQGEWGLLVVARETTFLAAPAELHIPLMAADQRAPS